MFKSLSYRTRRIIIIVALLVVPVLTSASSCNPVCLVTKPGEAPIFQCH